MQYNNYSNAISFSVYTRLSMTTKFPASKA